MKLITNKLIAFATLTLILSGCVNDSYDIPGEGDCPNEGILKTKEVSALYTQSTASTQVYPAVTETTPADYIEAYVISSEDGGNFYKSMYLQPSDGSKGLNVSLDEGNVYTKGFEVGRKIMIKLNGLGYANPSSFGRGLILGAPPTAQFAVDRIPSLEYQKFLFPTCSKVDEETLVNKITIAQATDTSPSNVDKYLNTLVEIDNVQFKSDCSTYSKKDFDTSLKITDGIKEIDLRTSRFASFAGKVVPSTRGTIRGVLTKYNSGYQIIIRREADVNFTEPRVAVVYPPKVGNAIAYPGTVNETFESYSTSSNGATFPKYINDIVVGFKYWDVATFSSNKYLQASAFNNGCTKAAFIMPVNLTTANSLSFKTKDGYNDGQPLKVYYSTDYVPGGDFNQATLVDITSSFTIASGTTSGYATNFTNSGNYSIPSTLTGNGYFIFLYDGTTGITTTMQLDDIVIN